MLFNLDFTNSIVLLCSFVFLLIIDLYFLVRTAIAQSISPIAELVIYIGIISKKAKAETEIHPLIKSEI